MIKWVSKFEIQNGVEVEVKNPFKTRPAFVENAKGFGRLDVLSPNPSKIKLITYWESDEDFEYWYHNHLRYSHINIPEGLNLVPKSWELSKYEHICS